MKGYAATIGFFDGVHRGHRHVVHTLLRMAEERGLQTLVVTFANHPLSVIRPELVPQQLCSVEEKCQRLTDAGADEVVLLNFTREMMQQSAYDFMKSVLRDQLHVRLLMLGYDNRFGRRQEGEGFEQYVEYGKELGIEVVCGPLPEEAGLFEGKPISSSLIRQLMTEGRAKDAEHLLNI